MKYKSIIFIIFISSTSNFCFSQTQSTDNVYFTLPEIALLNIEPNTNDIILEFEAPTEPGDELIPTGADTKWLNYTATLALGGTPKVVTAQVSSVTNIPGLTIELTISGYSGNGRGVFGTSVGTINLTTTAQTIITGIGGCFTRNGVNRGHEIEYNASISDYSVFENPVEPSMDVVFTISN